MDSRHTSLPATQGTHGRDKSNLTVTLLDSMDVTMEAVQGAGHGGVGCECELCGKF